MVGHVNHGLLIGCSTKLDVECIVALYRIFCCCSNIAREAILAILCLDSEGYRRIILLCNVVNLVQPTGSTTAVKTVAIVVWLQIICFACKSQLGVLDTVGVTAY